MKVSINWIKQFTDIDLMPDELVEKIGTQLGSVEEVINISEMYKGIVIAEIVSCEKHPNADKLKICMINDGGKIDGVERDSNGLVQVVCGAPNAREGLKVVWLPPGSVVPSSYSSDPFTLGSRELRGVMSNGMIASGKELAISDDHEGIIELEDDIELGTDFAKHYDLDDTVIDLENKMFTHRPDCFGVLGVAREVSGIYHTPFTSPDWYTNQPVFESGSSMDIEVSNSIDDIVPRFMAVAMDQVKVKPSPVWLQAALSKVGIKPINNVVDITNYIMHLTGQPLHAFDYDKLISLSDRPSIFPRLSNEGEKLTLLGGKEIELTGKEIVISTDKQAIALGGVMGGVDTEVDHATTRIVIECATFDMYSIRRTSMRFGLFTDAVTRFNKGQSSLQNDRVVLKAIEMMTELAGASQSSRVFDIASNKESSKTIAVTIDYLNDRLGIEMELEKVVELLRNVEIGVDTKDANLHIVPPFWRKDLNNPEDILEEVGRLYGYDKLSMTLPTRSAKPSPKNKLIEFKYQLRDKLSRMGANEVLTYSFVHGDLLNKVGIDPNKYSYHIRNAISPDLQYYRPSLTPSLLAKIHPNIKAQAGSGDNQFAIFEIGKSHIKGRLGDDNLPSHSEVLALVYAADDKTRKQHNLGDAYYIAKKYLDYISDSRIEYRPLQSSDSPLSAPFVIGRSAEVVVNDQVIGVIGEFNREAIRALKLPTLASGFEIDLLKLQNEVAELKYSPLPEFPPIKQDITIEVEAGRSYKDVLDGLEARMTKLAEEHGYSYDMEPLTVFALEGSDSRKISFRVTLWHSSRTLTTTEVNSLISQINQ